MEWPGLAEPSRETRTRREGTTPTRISSSFIGTTLDDRDRQPSIAKLERRFYTTGEADSVASLVRVQRA